MRRSTRRSLVPSICAVGRLETVQVHRPHLEGGAPHGSDDHGGTRRDPWPTSGGQPPLAGQADVARMAGIADLVERERLLSDEAPMDTERDVSAAMVVERTADVGASEHDARY